MKLSDLEATFIIYIDEKRIHHANELKDAHGVMFTCPCGTGHSVMVWFRDRGVPVDTWPRPRWIVDPSSRGLDTLTLTPSIALPCWHGFVTKGQAT